MYQVLEGEAEALMDMGLVSAAALVIVEGEAGLSHNGGRTETPPLL